MKKRTADLLSFAMIGVPVLYSVWLWPTLPDPMPSHWNTSGEVDGYLPKFLGVALLPLVAVGVWLMMKAIPYLSPKGFRTDKFSDVVQIFQLTMIAFMSLIAMLVLLEASGANMRMNHVVFAATGVLLAVIGNYLTKVRKNFFIGFRTPWTLASDEVWNRTHRVGGQLMVVSGVVMVFGVLLGVPVEWIIGIVIVCCTFPLVYSYILYRRLEGFESNSEDEPSE